MTDILDIARQMHSRSISRNLAGTVKQMLGTAQSVGCTVEGEPPHDIIDKIDEGEIDIPVSLVVHLNQILKFCIDYGFLFLPGRMNKEDFEITGVNKI